MKLPVACREVVDVSHLGLPAVLPPTEAAVWDTWDYRQRTFSVHRQTRSIVFRWLEHTWTPDSPLAIRDERYADEALCNAAMRCAKVLEGHYGGVAVRVILAELGPGCAIAPHVDLGPALVLPHRCHVPVLTNALVEFRIDDRQHPLREGIAYEVDNTRPHSVVNRGGTRRVHLICDVLVPNHLRALT